MTGFRMAVGSVWAAARAAGAAGRMDGGAGPPWSYRRRGPGAPALGSEAAVCPAATEPVRSSPDTW
jgi:hypothetical protein